MHIRTLCPAERLASSLLHCAAPKELWLGHTKIMLKNDNESPISFLFRGTLKVLRVENIESAQESHPAAYDSSSNASTEVTCKFVAGMARNRKACLEDRMKKRMPATHCAFYWLVEHASWVLAIRPQQNDGITPHKRLRGTNFNI